MHPAQARPLHPQQEWIFIPEDSTARKLFTCIPLFGIFVGNANEHSLLQKIQSSEDRERTIDLIDVKNEYKGASLIRNLLSAAGIIAAIAFGIFTSRALLFASALTGFALMQYSQIKHNQNIQDIIEENGLWPGVHVL